MESNNNPVNEFNDSNITIHINILNKNATSRQPESQSLRLLICVQNQLKDYDLTNFKSEKLIGLFARPFSFKISAIPRNMQMELSDLQCNSELKENTYTYEQLFSKINFAKNKTRSRLTNGHLENSSKVSFSEIKPDINELFKKMRVKLFIKH
ncbi:hypothetical protein PR048_003987 [Dryococelus australis]|uniref:Uncharacterized protein n=1 Tax=Dryococelus australis TaxID=614101 RepID=A0ABQ9I5D0_9NEOP|nr:hypothetical protein PR048_003987 [Dryococelus australis]